MLSRQLCESAGTRYVWLRLLATYGPKDDPRHLIPSTILKLLAAETPSLTAGEQRWDYLYVEDAAEALYEVAMNSRAQGVFNLGSGEVWSVRRIVERIRGLIDPNLPLGFGEAPYRADQVMHLQADISKLRREIDWRPRMNMDEGLKRTVEWHRANARRTKRGW
jgi:nucleoside-diphosphate-sugar epimerase